MAALIDKVDLAWTGYYDALKKFLAEDLKGIWEQLGGGKKVFMVDNTSISWRKTKNVLQLEGEKVDQIKQLLCSKMCGDSDGSSRGFRIKQHGWWLVSE